MKNILKYVVVVLLLAGVHSGYAGQFCQAEEEFLQAIRADGYQLDQDKAIALGHTLGMLNSSKMASATAQKWSVWYTGALKKVNQALNNADYQTEVRQVIQEVCDQVQQDKSKPDVRVLLLMQVARGLYKTHKNIKEEDQKFLQELADIVAPKQPSNPEKQELKKGSWMPWLLGAGVVGVGAVVAKLVYDKYQEARKKVDEEVQEKNTVAEAA